MTKKIAWLVVSCLMALSLVMASCGPAEVEEEQAEEEEEVVVEEAEEEEVEEEVVEEEEELLSPEVPKYGGVYTIVGREPMGFDEAYYFQGPTQDITNQELITGDWAKGPAGTGEVLWNYGFAGRIDLETGSLAESWNLPDDETIIFHIRKGVHWWDMAPVNGREFTAEDAAWNIDRLFSSPGSYQYAAYTRAGYGPTSAKALDKYTLEVKVPSVMQGMLLMVIGDYMWHVPPEMVEEHGDMKDWRNTCGTGAFILTDYVVSSSLTFESNPNYWEHDPVHPENQLPYIDTLKWLIMPDRSTQLAAFRTGKIDGPLSLDWDDAQLMMKTYPEMEYQELVQIVYPIPCGRMDKEELPFKDIRVRQALNMAVNQQEIIDEYYEGHADLLGYPYIDDKLYEPFCTPLEEQPEAVQELFTYNPEKARTLLAEAGYPDGFTTQIVCNTADVDFLSIIREYFLDIDVNMEINPLEGSIFESVRRGRKHEEMIHKILVGNMFPFRMLEVRIESSDDHAFYEDERVRACYEAVGAAVGKDDAEVAQLLKEIGPIVLESAWGVWLPAPHTWKMWWPWLQNFYGATSIGYGNTNRYCVYIWLDQALKESMGY